jgi:hypothetical protein
VLGLSALSCLWLACGKSARDGKEPPAVTAGTGTAGTDSQGVGASGGAGGANGGSGADTGGASGEGAASGSGQGGEDGELSSVELEGSPIYTRVQRLTNSQWERAVTDILRFGAPQNLSQNFLNAVAGTTDFTNNEKLLFVEAQQFLDFESAAEAAAALATGSAEALAALYTGTDAAGFVRTVGRRAFRRPLTDEEAARYEELFATGEALYGAGFQNGAALVIRGLLQSPHFLYRTELGPAEEPLSGYEAAAKLSLWLLGTTPSDALLDAAAAGELDDADGVEAAARAMLETPAALEVMRDLHGQLYDIASLTSVAKDGVPGYTPELNVELVEAAYRFFDGVFADGEGLPAVFRSTRGFVGPGLAPLYGIDPAPSALEQRDLGEARPGYFLQVPFLLLWSSGLDPDTGARGEALLENVLCADTAEESDWVLLGRALDGFDGMGQPREAGSVDTSGRFPFAEGWRDFSGGQDLMQILSESTQAHTCYAKKLTGYALQRDIVEDDRPLLEGLAEVSLTDSVKAMILSLVRDPAFRVRKGGTP